MARKVSCIKKALIAFSSESVTLRDCILAMKFTEINTCELKVCVYCKISSGGNGEDFRVGVATAENGGLFSKWKVDPMNSSDNYLSTFPAMTEFGCLVHQVILKLYPVKDQCLCPMYCK